MSTKTMERYESGISSRNLAHWGILEAVKELVQNNVYAKTVLGDTTSITHDGKYAIIKNYPSGFSKGKLLIGESDQTDVAGAPGQYGEGMKMAMAVAKRMNHEVMIETNGFNIHPKVEPSVLDNSVQVLTYYIENTEKDNGTTFKIECSKETLDKAISYFATLNGMDDHYCKTESIFTEKDMAGKIYINGVLVYETEAIFGYNFTYTDLMNRDRSSVDMGKLKGYVGSMVKCIDEVDTAVKVLKSIIKDNSLLESQAGNYSTTRANVWKEACEKLWGQKVAIGTGEKSDNKARYHRFKVLTNVPTSWSWFFQSVLGIVPTNQLFETAEVKKRTHKKPTTEEATVLGWAKMLIKKYYGDYGTVKICENLVDPWNNECYGMYERSSDLIWLDRRILSSKESTFKTLLHEVIHRQTGASDNTEEFTSAWEDACWKILLRGKTSL